MYRVKNKEVTITVFHNAESAKAAAKKAIHKELEKESEEVAEGGFWFFRNLVEASVRIYSQFSGM